MRDWTKANHDIFLCQIIHRVLVYRNVSLNTNELQICLEVWLELLLLGSIRRFDCYLDYMRIGASKFTEPILAAILRQNNESRLVQRDVVHAFTRRKGYGYLEVRGEEGNLTSRRCSAHSFGGRHDNVTAFYKLSRKDESIVKPLSDRKIHESKNTVVHVPEKLRRVWTLSSSDT